ncbi:MAG: glycosyltransferase family 4 protein [Caldilineaceae bacterium]|nr:glycosyltransferase family 4 protein [Caldilineaceae bacterium]
MSIRVAHITTIDLSLRYLLLNQLCSLQAAGYQVSGISAPGPDVPTVEAAGIRHIAVPMTRTFTPTADAKALAQLVRIMRRERFTIVHTHTPKPGLLGQLAARIAGVPIVVNTLHGFYFHDGMKPFWRNFYIMTEKIAARCSDVILSQNAEDMRTAVREGICRASAIKYLGNGIDIRRFDRRRIARQPLDALRHEFGLDPQRPVIGFVGRLVAEKGIHELLRAAQRLLTVAPTAQFLFVGPLDHEKPDAITPAIAADYGVAHACTFTGLREDVPELYALMDLFVLPSHREGFPRAPMEASAMGVPAIVTDIRGCREAVEDGVNGLLTPLGDCAALAAAMLRLLQQPTLAHTLGAGGRRLAEERFDEELVFAKVKAEYSRLLALKGQPDQQEVVARERTA